MKKLGVKKSGFALRKSHLFSARIYRPVFAKTSLTRSFSLIENKRFGLVFAKTGSINSGTGLWPWLWPVQDLWIQLLASNYIVWCGLSVVIQQNSELIHKCRPSLLRLRTLHSQKSWQGEKTSVVDPDPHSFVTYAWSNVWIDNCTRIRIHLQCQNEPGYIFIILKTRQKNKQSDTM